MARIFETDMEGNQYEWYATEGQCPRCGAPCVLEVGQNDISPDRLVCDYCGYKEGYDE